MVLTILKQILTVHTSLDTWVGGDLYLYWMLLSVRSDLYHIIYMVLCVRDILQIPIIGGADDYVTEVCQQWLFQWKGKALHGKFFKKVAKVVSLASVLSGCCMVILRCQQRLRWWLHKIRHWLCEQCSTLNCRVCGMVPEYVDHLLSGCTLLATTWHKQRRNRLANIVH